MSKIRISQFYWSDYMADPALFVCTMAAQGFWMRCLCLMACSERPGFLLLNGRKPTFAQLAKLAGASETDVEDWCAELEANGVPSMTDGRDQAGAGVWFNRRLVRDIAKYEAAVEHGKKGGNPALKRTSDTEARAQFDATADLAMKRMSAAERQRRRRLKLKQEQGRHTSRDVTPNVTRDSVTSHVTVTRDSVTPKRDKVHGRQGRKANVTGVKGGDNPLTIIHNPYSDNPEPLSSTPSAGRPAGGPPPATPMGGGGLGAPSPRKPQPAAPARTPAEQLAALRQAAVNETQGKPEGANPDPACGMGSRRPQESHPAPANAQERAPVRRTREQKASARAATVALLAETLAARTQPKPNGAHPVKPPKSDP